MYDIVVIGAGPAGYTAALRAGQLGLESALIDPVEPGGRGLHQGVMFLKGIMESARRYREVARSNFFGIEGVPQSGLSLNWNTAVRRAQGVAGKVSGQIAEQLSANGVSVLRKKAKIAGPNAVTVGDQTLETGHIIVATGASPRRLPFSVPPDMSRSVWSVGGLDRIPENVVVYGSNPIAAEYAQFFSLAGSRVTILGDGGPFLPGLDETLAARFREQLRREQITILDDYQSVSAGSKKLKVDTSTVDCDVIVNCGPTEGLLPESQVALEYDRGFLRVNERYQTSEPSIYAVGDVNGITVSARQAAEQGYAAVELTVGHKRPTTTRLTPYLVYTVPELAQIGSTAAELRHDGIPFEEVEVNLEHNAKALLEETGEGFVRLLYAKKSGAVLGVQIMGHDAIDMASEAMSLLRFNATVSDLAQIVHAHPTVSEAFSELGRRASAAL
jgi:dihydrolipoamide dehydrogenase